MVSFSMSSSRCEQGRLTEASRPVDTSGMDLIPYRIGFTVYTQTPIAVSQYPDFVSNVFSDAWNNVDSIRTQCEWNPFEWV